jgi:hypothetical protein
MLQGGTDMNFYGLALGVFTFLIIGVGHVIVVKAEYYFTKHVWPVFLMIGLAAAIASLFVKNDLVSGTLGIASFVFLWSIHEVIEQEERVKKGWFPKNPNRS